MFTTLPISQLGVEAPAVTAHGLVPADFHQIQLLLGLHVVGGDTGPLGDLHQPLGIAAVAAPHHHQGLSLPGQFLDLGLAGGGGVADGIENLRLGKPGGNLLDPGLKLGLALGGLGHHDQLVKVRQVGHILGGGYYVTPFLGVAQQAPNLRVVGVPHDQSGEPFGGPAPDDGLDLGYPGAGGIDDTPAGLLQQAPFLGRDAVGPDNHQSLRHFFPGLQDRDPPFPQQFQDLGVMDQGPIGVNPGLVFVDGLQDHLQRPLDADTKPGGAGQNYLHRELPPMAAGCAPCPGTLPSFRYFACIVSHSAQWANQQPVKGGETPPTSFEALGLAQARERPLLQDPHRISCSDCIIVLGGLRRPPDRSRQPRGLTGKPAL